MYPKDLDDPLLTQPSPLGHSYYPSAYLLSENRSLEKKTHWKLGAQKNFVKNRREKAVAPFGGFFFAAAFTLSLSSPSFSCSDSYPPGIDFLRGFHFRESQKWTFQRGETFWHLYHLWRIFKDRHIKAKYIFLSKGFIFTCLSNHLFQP